MPDNEIKVTFPGGLRVDAAYRGLLIQTDQPVEDGGGGTAPWPFALFLASLATCVGYYVLSFCRSRRIPVEGIDITMKIERDPKSHMVSRIINDISLPPGFPDKYVPAVVRAAEQCTVKKHFQFPPDIQTNAAVR